MPLLPTALLALALLQQAPPAAPAPRTEADEPQPGVISRSAPGELSLRTDRRYRVERIDFRGLSHTRADEARRHILVTEGDILDQERVLLSRLRLLQLGWFSRVETRVERGSERGLVVLVFDVVERNTLVFTDLIIGSTDAQPIYGGFGLSQQNFLGRGLGLSGAWVYGGTPQDRPGDPSRFALRGSFFAPDLTTGRLPPLVFGVSGLFMRGEEFACTDPDCSAFTGNFAQAPRIRYQRAGGDVTLGFRPGPFERIFGTYRYERVHATGIDLAVGVTGVGPAVLPGWSTDAGLIGTYEIDTRDDFFFPTEGYRGLAQVTLGSRLVGSDYEYSRYLLQLESAYVLAGKRLRLQSAIGVAQGGAPFFDRFYPADFSYFAIGPAIGRALELNFSTDSRYDAFLVMGGLEYGIPLWSRGSFFQRGYVALGARAVYSTATLGGSRTKFSAMPFSWDVALRLDTPVGTFNASLGYLLDNFL